MPLQKLQFRPGVNRESTTLANEGGWFDCDKVRFRSGYPEKIGGWAAQSYNTFLGTCRSLWNWVTLKQYNLLGVGTNLKFYVEDGGAYYDITPIRDANTNQTTFSAVTIAPYSSTITVTDAGASGFNPGDFVTFTNAVALSTQTYTANATTDVITFSNALPNGTTIELFTTGTAPGGLAVGTTYYVVNASGATCQLSLTLGGSAINITTTGTGTQTFALTTGITAAVLNQEYQIVAATGANTYTIQARAAVAGNVATTNGGAPVLSTAYDVGDGGANTDSAYQLNIGFDIAVIGTGWGTGPWSRGSWGSGYTSGFSLQLRLWSQSNFGENLLLSPRGGALYVWLPGSGATPAFGTRAVLVDPAVHVNTPSQINQIMVSDSTRIVIAFGSTNYVAPLGDGAFDPLLVRWSSQESYTDWTPSATNQAGSYRLSHGSEIVGALQTRQEILVWTDSSIYSMQYLGPPYIWGFTLLADNISIVSQNAMATAAGVTYWMGTDKFYAYSGRVETLPCSVRQYVFQNINREQEAQFFAGTNEGYSEVWWFYCSISGPNNTGTVDNPNTVIDRYVIFNYLDRVWYYGSLGRTAWLDSPLRQYPQAATLGNILVFHEAIVDDGETNPPSPISAYIQSSDFDIGDGHNYGFAWRVIPDITFDGSTTPAPLTPQVTFTTRPRQNPGAPYGATNSPTVTSDQNYAQINNYTVQEFTEIIYTRVRGRQLAFKVSSDTLGTQWQLGTPRIDVRPDGRR